MGHSVFADIADERHSNAYIMPTFDLALRSLVPEPIHFTGAPCGIRSHGFSGVNCRRFMPDLLFPTPGRGTLSLTSWILFWGLGHRCVSPRFAARHSDALRPKRFLNQRENALSPEKPSMPAISFSGR